jgi:hypothetical protein
MKRATVLTVLILSLYSLTFGQGQQQAMPAPGPEIQMMGYFAGSWTLQGKSKISPTSPSAPFTATETSAWVPGSYFLETHTSSNSALGSLNGVRVMEYNPADKVYTYNAYNSLGEHTVAIGHVQGGTWIWTAEEKLNGLVTKGRYTITIVSPSVYTFKSEVATPSGGWAGVMEGKATRAQ